VSLWISDTDCLTLFQHGQRKLVERVARLPQEQVTTTIVTLEEQVRGRFNLVRRAETIEQLVNAYQRLQEAMVFFQRFQVLEFSLSAGTCYQSLKDQKLRVGSRDLRIAAIALANDGIVVTRNQKDFSQVPGLKIEDWLL
jgi:tRNA(fMet)-specific endonuclease VapC